MTTIQFFNALSIFNNLVVNFLLGLMSSTYMVICVSVRLIRPAPVRAIHTAQLGLALRLKATAIYIILITYQKRSGEVQKIIGRKNFEILCNLAKFFHWDKNNRKYEKIIAE